MGWLPGREAGRLRWLAMQLLMKVSRGLFCSFLASALALQPRMRCCTFFETGVAGTTCRGGVAVTGWVPLLSARARDIPSAVPIARNRMDARRKVIR